MGQLKAKARYPAWSCDSPLIDSKYTESLKSRAEDPEALEAKYLVIYPAYSFQTTFNATNTLRPERNR